MNCQHVQHAMVELVDGTLPSAQMDDLHAHIATCASCTRQWRNELQWRDAMLHLPAPAMRPQFGIEALARARAAHTPPATVRHGFRTGFITAMAASVTLWIAVGLWTGPRTIGQQENQVPVVRVALYQASAIDLVFHAPEDFGVATIAMQLPANFEIAGQPGVRELTFESPIKQGNNRLVIPIVATAPGAGEFLAKIHHLDKQKEFRVRLDTHERLQKSHTISNKLTT